MPEPLEAEARRGKTRIMYNAKLKVGAHHLTKDIKEYNTLPKYGWKQEGVALKALR